MNNNIRIITSILLVLIAIYSCENEVTIDVPSAEPHLVINGILTPDSPIYIRVSHNDDYINNPSDTFPSWISNATVLLYENNIFVDSLSYDSIGYYSSECYSKSDYTYSIIVSADGFETINAETSIPTPVMLDSVIIYRNTAVNKKGFNTSQVIAYFTDSVSDISYYMHNGTVNENYIEDPVFFFQTPLYSYDPAVLEEGSHLYSPDKSPYGNKVFTNKTYSNGIKALTLEYEDIFDLFTYYPESESYTIYLQILSISKEYFDYEKSIVNYYNAKNSFYKPNNPANLYSNIDNGSGIFAGIAYSCLVKENVKFK